MKWTSHKGGLERSEEGHIIAQRAPDRFELTMPDGRTHTFVSVQEARTFVEGVTATPNGNGEATTAELPTPPPPPAQEQETAGAQTVKVKTSKPKVEKSGDQLTDKYRKRLAEVAVALREAGFEAGAGLIENAASSVTWPPDPDLGVQLARVIPADMPDKLQRVVTRLSEHLQDDPSTVAAGRGSASGPELWLSRIYGDRAAIKRNTPKE